MTEIVPSKLSTPLLKILFTQPCLPAFSLWAAAAACTNIWAVRPLCHRADVPNVRRGQMMPLSLLLAPELAVLLPCCSTTWFPPSLSKSWGTTIDAVTDYYSGETQKTRCRVRWGRQTTKSSWHPKFAPACGWGNFIASGCIAHSCSCKGHMNSPLWCSACKWTAVDGLYVEISEMT